VARHNEIVDAGVKEVALFHSSDAELLPFQGRFAFDVIGDLGKALYRKYGVESSISALLAPKVFAASLKGNLKKDKPKLGGLPNGVIFGLPALLGHRQRRRAAQIEVSAVPDVGLDDPPAADQSAVRRCAHAGAARSLGSRARL
jgi:hypothetical protein